VGLFPKHLTDIAKLVDDAKDSIDILADCVDYGSFIDPNGHKQLFDKIIEAKIQRGIRIRILVCGPPQPITRISNFYDNAPEQEKFQEFYQSRDKSFKSLYETYISMLRMDNDFVMFLKNISGDEQIRQVVKEFVDKRPRQNENGSPILSGNEFKRLVEQCILELEKHGAIKFIGDDEFTILLEIRQKWFENKLKGIGAIVEYAPNEIVPIFCWLKDNILDSVFVFSESVTKTRGMGFRTQDSDLVGIFHNIFENQWTALQR
jgi:hypothetical protein